MTKPNSDIANFFTQSFKKHGATARGLDWNSDERHRLSMMQCLGLFRGQESFSVLDLGSGYGPFYDLLIEVGFDPDYIGYDISAELISEGQKRHSENPKAQFVVGSHPTEAADFAVAGGIFNLRFDREDKAWLNYILTTLDNLHNITSKGFAFNCLTKYSDADKMRPDLYYADPGYLFDYCKKNYSRNVALLHDYEAYEFTIIVRK